MQLPWIEWSARDTMLPVRCSLSDAPPSWDAPLSPNIWGTALTEDIAARAISMVVCRHKEGMNFDASRVRRGMFAPAYPLSNRIMDSLQIRIVPASQFRTPPRSVRTLPNR